VALGRRRRRRKKKMRAARKIAMSRIRVRNDREDDQAEQAEVLYATDGYYGLRPGSGNGEQLRITE